MMETYRYTDSETFRDFDGDDKAFETLEACDLDDAADLALELMYQSWGWEEDWESSGCPSVVIRDKDGNDHWYSARCARTVSLYTERI